MQEKYKLMLIVVRRDLRGRLREIMAEYQGLPEESALTKNMLGTDIFRVPGTQDGERSAGMFCLDAALTGGLYALLEEKLAFTEKACGVALTIPISNASGFCGKLMQYMMIRAEYEGVRMVKQKYEHKFELIVTVVTKGDAEKVKEAAVRSGAKGGTIFHGQGMGGEKAAQLLGISIDPEKDVVMIVAEREVSGAIMKAIVDDCGIETAAKGICFSLPVDSAIGLRSDIGPED